MSKPVTRARSDKRTGVKQKGEAKIAKLPRKIAPTLTPPKKPDWIRVRLAPNAKSQRVKKLLRQHSLHTVCEEASCPNLSECFGKGTATFMIMGDICTRRCPFCDVAHGRPNPLNPEEPASLAATIHTLGLSYVVITSVDRDDLQDGGADHFAACIEEIRKLNSGITIEVLVPDFKKRADLALQHLARAVPDVFNHNLETVPRLYPRCRPVADYRGSLSLLDRFKRNHPEIPTKSGLMLGLGETLAEVKTVMQDLRRHRVDMLTLGQYLQPSRYHLPVDRFVTPEEFHSLKIYGDQLGFSHVASGPMVRSSYHADLQAEAVLRK